MFPSYKESLKVHEMRAGVAVQCVKPPSNATVGAAAPAGPWRPLALMDRTPQGLEHGRLGLTWGFKVSLAEIICRHKEEVEHPLGGSCCA